MNYKKIYPLFKIIYLFLSVFLIFNCNYIINLSVIFAVFIVNYIYFLDKKGAKNIVFISVFCVIYSVFYAFSNHFGTTILYGSISANPITLEAVQRGVFLGVKIADTSFAFYLAYKLISLENIISIIGRRFPNIAIIILVIIRAIKGFLGNILTSSPEKNINTTFDELVEKTESMKARGFGAKGRQSFYPYSLNNTDRAAIILIVLVFMLNTILNEKSLISGVFLGIYFLIPVIFSEMFYK